MSDLSDRARLLRIPIEYAPGAETGGSAVVALADVADAMLRLDDRR